MDRSKLKAIEPIGQILPIPGMAEIRAILWIVRNQEKLDALVQGIEDKRATANKQIAVVGKAAEIEKLHEQTAKAAEKAEAAEKQAEETILEAQRRAEDILRDAEAKKHHYDSVIHADLKKLEERQQAITQAEEALAVDNAEATRELRDKAADVERQMAALERKEKELDAKRGAIEKDRETVDTQLKKISSFQEAFGGG